MSNDLVVKPVLPDISNSTVRFNPYELSAANFDKLMRGESVSIGSIEAGTVVTGMGFGHITLKTMKDVTDDMP